MVRIDFATLNAYLSNRQCPVFMYSDGTVSLELDLKKRLIGCWDNLNDASADLKQSVDICVRVGNQLLERCFPFYVDTDWRVVTKMPAGEVIGRIWDGLDYVSEPCDGVFPKVGWYAFAGGKFSPDPKAYANCQGVVGWVNPDKSVPQGQRGLIVTPDEVKAVWSNDYCETNARDEYDGKYNTEKLIAYSKKHKIKFPAAEWCVRYSKNGVSAGEGFMPALKQLERIVANRGIVNPALQKIDGSELHGWIWSSFEGTYYGTWLVRATDGNVYHATKDDVDYVRCVLAF